MSIADIFNSKWLLNPETGCWVWIRGCYRNGYGSFHFKGHSYKAHRFSYTLFKGPIPEGLKVCHSCDNKKCVNPAHLWLGTQRENINDYWNKVYGLAGTSRGNLLKTLPEPHVGTS